jgi:hypothetical protein
MQHCDLFHTYSPMNQREEKEFLLHYAPRKERKAIRKRRKAAKRTQIANQITSM